MQNFIINHEVLNVESLKQELALSIKNGVKEVGKFTPEFVMEMKTFFIQLLI